MLHAHAYYNKNRGHQRERENIKFFIYEGKYARMFFLHTALAQTRVYKSKGTTRNRQTDTERDDQPLHKQRKLRLHYVHNFYSKRQCVNENVTRKPQEVEEDWPSLFFFRNIL